MGQRDLEAKRDDFRTVVLEPMDMEDDDEIDLGELVLSVLRDWKILIVAAILCAALAGILSRTVLKRSEQVSYIASTMVSLEQEEVGEGAAASGAVDAALLMMLNSTTQNNDLSKEFQSLIVDGAVLQRVIDELKLDMSIGALRGCVEMEESKTKIIRISVRTGDPALSSDIMAHLRDAGIDSMSKLMNSKKLNANYTDITLEEDRPSGLSTKKLVAIGGIAGFMCFALLSVLLAIFDKRMKNAKDLDKYVGLPIMAVVTEKRR